MENRCNDLNTIVDLRQDQTSKDKGIAMKKVFLLIKAEDYIPNFVSLPLKTFTMDG